MTPHCPHWVCRVVNLVIADSCRTRQKRFNRFTAWYPQSFYFRFCAVSTSFAMNGVPQTEQARLHMASVMIGLVRITSWYPNFNGSHFGLPPSEIHRMTGLPPKIVWTMTYSQSRPIPESVWNRTQSHKTNLTFTGPKLFCAVFTEYYACILPFYERPRPLPSVKAVHFFFFSALSCCETMWLWASDWWGYEARFCPRVGNNSLHKSVAHWIHDKSMRIFLFGARRVSLF